MHQVTVALPFLEGEQYICCILRRHCVVFEGLKDEGIKMTNPILVNMDRIVLYSQYYNMFTFDMIEEIYYSFPD